MRCLILLALITVSGCVAADAQPPKTNIPTLVAPMLTRPQVVCGPRRAVVRNLAGKYGEKPIVMGLTSKKNVMEVYANAKTTSWTIVVTRPNGVSCLLSAGDALEEIGPKPKGSES